MAGLCIGVSCICVERRLVNPDFPVAMHVVGGDSSSGGGGGGGYVSPYHHFEDFKDLS